VEWLDEAGVAERIRDLKRDTTAWLGRTFTGQFSLAGAQAKSALLFRDGRWGVPSGAMPTTHILKPAVSGFDDHDLNEHLCLSAARRAGLRVVPSSVEVFEDEPALVLERYDRTSRDDVLLRVHQEDMCQALSVHPDRKYQNQGGPTPAQVARLLRGAMPPTFAEGAVRQFADALIWNWLIGGTDAHAKNYSLLLSGRQVRLAPLYDVASILPYGFNERELKMAMKVGGQYARHPGRNTWPRAAADLGLDADQVLDRVRELARVAPDAFADAAAQEDVRRLDRALPERLVGLIANRAARCARVVA
jgi:serine/threonine-protein kinase HipA